MIGKKRESRRAARRGQRAQASLVTRAGNSARLAAVAARERRVPYWPEDRIERMQRRRIRAIVAYAYERVPFYRETMRKGGLRPDDFRCAADLARLPPLEPGTVQDDPERFTSDLHGPGRRWGFHTSGSSTGLRRVVYWDNRGLLLETAIDGARPGAVISRLAEERWAGTILRTLAGERNTPLRRLLGYAAGGGAEHRRVSIFPADLSSRSLRTLRSELTFIPKQAGHHSHLSPQDTYQRAAELIGEVRPRVVFSFGSYADQYFRYLSDGGQTVPVPRVWVYTGDMASPETSELAARFGCQLYSIYATTEVGEIGFQCEQRAGFHLNVDLCAVRLVNDDGADVPVGHRGDIVVSNLHNRAMVLLNFRIGDCGELAAEPCSCGRGLPVLAHLEGRRSAVVTLADGRCVSSLSIEGLFRTELRPTRQTQIVQRAPGELCMRVVPFQGVDQTEMSRALIARGREVLGAGTALTVQFVDEIA